MCELFGFSGKKEKNLTTLLTKFFSHAPNNPDGWGIARFDGGKTQLYKEKISADKSSNLLKVINEMCVSSNLIAHIRLATIGVDEYENTHPFSGRDKTGRTWTLIHNGTIFECDDLHIYSYRQIGSTDSERIFLYLIDKINSKSEVFGRALTEEERFDLIDEIIVRLSPKNKLNLIISDGEVTYLHTNYKDSLYVSKDEEGAVFSTTPLNEGIWDHLPFAQLVSYKNGELLNEGTEHGNEYIPDEQSIRALYMAYAGL